MEKPIWLSLQAIYSELSNNTPPEQSPEDYANTMFSSAESSRAFALK